MRLLDDDLECILRRKKTEKNKMEYDGKKITTPCEERNRGCILWPYISSVDCRTKRHTGVKLGVYPRNHNSFYMRKFCYGRVDQTMTYFSLFVLLRFYADIFTQALRNTNLSFERCLYFFSCISAHKLF